MEKEAYYFPHFSNARNDRKIKRMKKDLGFLGYAVYFMILEILRDQPELKYPLSDLDLLLDEFQIDSADLNKIINEYELFDFDNEGNFYSPKQHEYLQPWFEKKKKRSLAGQKGMASRWQKTQSESGSDNNVITNELQTDNNVITPLYQCYNNVITKKRKEKKRKESIEEKNILKKEIEITHPLQIFVRDTFPTVSKLKDQLTEKECEKLVNDFDKNLIKTVLEQMENYKPLLTKYKSVNLTLRNWIKNELERTNAINKPAYKPNSTFNKRVELTLDDLDEAERASFIVGAN